VGPVVRTVSMLSLLVGAVAAAPATDDAVPLEGVWRFRLDASNVGLAQRWWASDLPDTIELPGSVEQRGYGERTIGATVGKLTRVRSYVGPAWFQRDIAIPEGWAGRRVVLFLERCHWETQVYIDSALVGTQNSLCVPHVYDVTRQAFHGRHRLTVRVDNTIKINIGNWGHSITDETQTNWNGIVGRIELRATSPVFVESAQAYPDPAARSVTLRARIGNATGRAVRARLTATPHLRGTDEDCPCGATEVEVPTEGAEAKLVLPLGDDAALWDESSPHLYDVQLDLLADGEPADSTSITFGLRGFTKTDRRFLLNGRPIFLRGTLECAIFPLTGYPPTDVDAWGRIIGIAQSYGLNHIRFHSWCPPEAAFAAADEMGMTFQVEAPFWSGAFGDPAVTGFIDAETERIVDTYGNHPSFCLMSMGNELLLGGGDATYLNGLVNRLRQRDPRHLYTCSTCPHDLARVDDYFASAYGPGPGPLRGQGILNSETPGTDGDYSATIGPCDRPIIAHELGQWAMYPNLDEVRKCTGVLQARNFDGYRQSLTEHGMLDQAEAFRQASGAFMLLLYKEEIERCLRTPELAGFQLLDVHDFPGQGTALVGMLDPFWDSKGLIDPEEFRSYCSVAVPLLRTPRRVLTTADRLQARIELANYGPAPHPAFGRPLPEGEADRPLSLWERVGVREPAARVRWTFETEHGDMVDEGVFEVAAPTGGVTAVGGIDMPLADLEAPAVYTLRAKLEGGEEANEWRLWLYPAELPTEPDGPYVTDSWDADTVRRLAAGESVVLLANYERLDRTVPGSFTPVFWCTRLFPGQPGTMGILCDPKHPAFAEFPTATHSDWQWFDVLTRSAALILDDTPPGYRPLIQAIDNFDRNHKLAYAFEARVGRGKLLVTTIGLTQDLDTRPAARQLRHSLLSYAASPRFEPQQELTASLLDSLLSVSPLYSMERAPEDMAQAVLHVVAGANVGMRESPRWQPEHDKVIARKEGFGYRVEGGSWLDETDSAWHDPHLGVIVTCPKGFEGTLYAHFSDWNSLGRAAEITFESRKLGTLGDHTGDGFWLAVPVTPEQSADGELALRADVVRSHNAMVTELLVVPSR